MTAAVRDETFVDRNQQQMVADLERVRARLEALALAGAEGAGARLDGRRPDRARPATDAGQGRLGQLVDTFGLSPFERDVVVLAAGCELDGSFGGLCARASGDSRQEVPTFGLALAALAEPHWDAVASGSPLRYWRLLELGPGTGLVARPLRIDERVLSFLTGVSSVDPRLDGILVPETSANRLAPSQRSVAHEVVALVERLARPVPIGLEGADEATRRAVAQHVATDLGRMLLIIRARRLPAAVPDVAAVARLVEREAALLGAIVLVECGSSDDAGVVAALIDSLRCPLLVGNPGPLLASAVPLRRAVELPSGSEQADLWHEVLTSEAGALDGVVEQVATHFRFGVPTIDRLAAELAATGGAGTGGPATDDIATRLRRACREQARTGLDELAQRIPPAAAWSDLVLPPESFDALRDLAGQVSHRRRVYEDWGMAGKSPRGLGITALFVGESGTGKTLAAEVLAGELDLDLYRIDLSAVVSKYIGETEKNLRRVFDAAETSGAVLLFDEADALFGKRSEVKDSHDRYANVEISYLLQRMESYSGLAILTTNLKSSIDRAFLRRIRFVVNFPFPELAHRARMWSLMLPDQLPVAELDIARLARLQVPGGNIRNIALSAAFLAAESGGPVTMNHLLQAARREYAKLEKPLTESEIGGWT